MGSLSRSRTIPVVLDRRRSAGDAVVRASEEVIGTDFDAAMQLRIRLSKAIRRGQPLLLCARCGWRPVKLAMFHDKSGFYFKHDGGDGDCEWRTGGRPKALIDRDRYLGQREGRAHKRMKTWIEASLRADPRFSDIAVEKNWVAELQDGYRRPDVAATFASAGGAVRVAFEAQLSSTFHDVMQDRAQFYLSQGALVVWILPRFALQGARATYLDAFWLNNQNALVVNAETVEASALKGAFVLEVHWAADGGRSGRDSPVATGRACFHELTLRLEEQQAFLHDVAEERQRVEAERLERDARNREDIERRRQEQRASQATERLEAIRQRARELLLLLAQRGHHVVLAEASERWSAMRSALLDLLIDCPPCTEDRLSPLVALAKACWSAETGVPASGHRSLRDFAHYLYELHPEAAWAFVALAHQNGKLSELDAADESGRLLEKRKRRARARREGLLDPEDQHAFDGLLAFAFPALGVWLDQRAVTDTK